MPRCSLHTLLLIGFVSSFGLKSRPAAPNTERNPAPLTCVSISQVYATTPNVFLTADVPTGATDLHPVFEVKGPHDTDPWVQCKPSTMCDGVVLPDQNHPGADPDDGALHYAAYVSPQGTTSFPFSFTSPRYFRLISQYTIISPTCVSEFSFEVASNADSSVQIVVPPGKSISRITTFMRELIPASQHWMQCHDWVNPAAGNFSATGCPIFLYAYVTQPPDPYDHAQSVLVTCTNKIVNGTVTTSSPNRRGCRVRVEY